MKKIDELIAEKKELEEAIRLSRNEAVKAEYADKIKKIDEDIESMNSETLEKEISFQKEAPARMDHKDDNKTGFGAVTIGTFKMI